MLFCACMLFDVFVLLVFVSVVVFYVCVCYGYCLFVFVVFALLCVCCLRCVYLCGCAGFCCIFVCVIGDVVVVVVLC